MTRHSYRDLPLRYSEPGLLHRNEASGVLHGLLRVRHFAQDDGHIFCTEEQVQEEVRGCLEMAFATYELFDFEVRLELSTRPEQRIGDDELWDRAELKLTQALEETGARLRAEPRRRRLLRAEDRHAHDRLARALLADRDGPARLLDAGPLRAELHRRGQRRAHAGDDPPGDVRLLRAVHRDPDRALRRASCRCGSRRCRRSCSPSPTASTTTRARSPRELREADLRVEVDDRSESVGRKIREAELRKAPFMLIVGEREQEERTVVGARPPRRRPRRRALSPSSLRT